MLNKFILTLTMKNVRKSLEKLRVGSRLGLKSLVSTHIRTLNGDAMKVFNSTSVFQVYKQSR